MFTLKLKVLVVKARLAVFDVPFSVAVIVTVALSELFATAANWAVAAPANTVTVGGTMTAVLLLLKLTVIAVAAAPLRVTVQVLEDAPEIDVGVQASEPSVGDALVTVTMPPVPDSDTAAPAGEAATVFAILNVEVCAAVTLTVAITPFSIAVAFMPYAMQVYDPAAGLHVSDFPAAVSAGPATAEIAVIPDAGY